MMRRNLRQFVADCTGETVIRYGDIVREERYFCAVLFHLLISDRPFLGTFLKECGVPDVASLDLGKARVYVEYAMARDLWHKMSGNDERKLEFIQEWVPGLRDRLPEAFGIKDPKPETIEGFNRALVAGPISKKYIQSPARWSVAGICKLFTTEEDLTQTAKDSIKAACRLKWAFNVKPDLVIELGDNRVVCIEAKVESSESRYSAAMTKNDVLQDGWKYSQKQTEVQKFLVEEVLGFENVPVFLSVRKSRNDQEGTQLTWKCILDKAPAHAKAQVGEAREHFGDWLRAALP